VIDVPQGYQLTFFCNTDELLPTADNISAMLDVFRDRGLLPGTIQELQLTGPQVRLRFSSPSEEWNVNIPTGRIDIHKNSAAPMGANLGTVDAFVADAVDLLTRVLRRFPRKGNRLSLVTVGLLPEMSDQAMAETYKRIFRPVGIYASSPAVEWDARSVVRVHEAVGLSTEAVNAIATIKRTQGQMGQASGLVPFDRIQLSFDINTYHGTTDYRFESGDLAAAYGALAALRSRILQDLKAYFDV